MGSGRHPGSPEALRTVQLMPEWPHSHAVPLTLRGGAGGREGWDVRLHGSPWQGAGRPAGRACGASRGFVSQRSRAGFRRAQAGTRPSAWTPSPEASLLPRRPRKPDFTRGSVPLGSCICPRGFVLSGQSRRGRAGQLAPGALSLVLNPVSSMEPQMPM